MRQSTKELLLKTEKHLDGLSNQLIDELTRIAEGDWGLNKSASIDNVHFLDIEVFIDGYRLSLYPMDSSSTQLGYKSLLNGYSDGLLSDEELNPNLDLYDFKNPDDNKELDESDNAQREIFIKWFVGCWHNTDKRTLTKPIYLMFHDTSDSLDLNANKWVKK